MVKTVRENLWNQDTGAPALFGSCCRKCGAKYFPARKICWRCYSTDQEKIILSQRGTVYAFCNVFFKKNENDETPYTVGYVLLEDGITMPARICCPRESLKVGTPVVLEAGVTGLFPDGKEKPGYFFKLEVKEG
ncbi:MAG: OB-fold domain-containing protein [Bacillota bacterium]